MSFIKDTWKDVTQFGIPFSLIIYIILGYAFIWLSNEHNNAILILLDYFQLNDAAIKFLKESSKIVGQTIIVSGVATSLLRTNFFTNILQKQLFKVVYTDDLLKNRRDIMDIWSRVSKVLYSNKFPDIADSINEIITRKYFPIEKHYYYHKNETSLRIELLDKASRSVRTTQINTGVIKLHRNMFSAYNPWDSKNRISLKGGIDIYDVENESIPKVSVSKGRFNNKEIDAVFNNKREGTKYTYDCVFDLRHIPGDTINYEYTVEKEYTLNDGIDTITVLANNIHYDSTLYINYDPNDLKICFIDLGTPDNFKDINRNSPPGQICKKYEGVIFPGQGHGIALQIA